jgi:hypothetical protein
MRDVRSQCASPFFFIRNWIIARFSIVSIRKWTQEYRNCTHFRNSHIFTQWAYFTQILNESQIFTQMAIFLHTGHISHKYPMKVKFLYKWPYFNTLSIFYTIILVLSVAVLVFSNSWLFHGGRCASTELLWPWYYWFDHRGDERRNLIKLIKLFLTDGIIDSDDSSFYRYNYLKSFVYCVWNIEHLSNMFC